MVTPEIVVFFEGTARLRPAMSRFLDPLRQEARKKRVGLKVIPCDDKARTEKYFNASNEPLKLLLIDSDGPPLGEPDPRKHYMVEVMENWIVADWATVVTYFGSNAEDPTRAKNIEKISKKEALEVLEQVAQARGKRYHKVVDGAALLERIRLTEVRNRAEHCGRFCGHVEDIIKGH